MAEPNKEDSGYDDPTVLTAQWLEHRIVHYGPEEALRLSDGESVVEFTAEFGGMGRSADRLEAAGTAMIEFAEKVRSRPPRQPREPIVIFVPEGGISGPG